MKKRRKNIYNFNSFFFLETWRFNFLGHWKT